MKALFDNLEDGATVSEFLEWFPGVTKQQIETMLEFAGQSLGVTEQSRPGMKILFDQGTPAQHEPEESMSELESSPEERIALFRQKEIRRARVPAKQTSRP